MAAARRLPDALLGGTAGMRAAGKVFLPIEPAETEAAYRVRLERSFLFPGYAKAVHDLADKVFGKPIAIGDDVPLQLSAASENVDLTGRGLDVFGHAVFLDGIHSGISYILVEMDPAPTDEAGRPVRLSRAQEREMQRRPWAVHVRAEQVLGWRSETVGGVERLTQFRFRETITEDDGDYGEKAVEQIRVFRRDGSAVIWEVHRKTAGGSWVLHKDGVVTIGEIAVCPVYINRTGFHGRAAAARQPRRGEPRPLAEPERSAEHPSRRSGSDPLRRRLHEREPDRDRRLPDDHGPGRWREPRLCRAQRQGDRRRQDRPERPRVPDADARARASRPATRQRNGDGRGDRPGADEHAAGDDGGRAQGRARADARLHMRTCRPFITSPRKTASREWCAYTSGGEGIRKCCAMAAAVSAGAMVSVERLRQLSRGTATKLLRSR